jgi:hypothetical protein
MHRLTGDLCIRTDHGFDHILRAGHLDRWLHRQHQRHRHRQRHWQRHRRRYSGTVRLTTTAADALTLANGANGQLLTIVMVVDGGDGTLTPTTKTGYTTITFGDVGDSVTLQYFTTLGWMIVSNYGATIA